eukprot:219216-Pyramimonas_sp.AAC.1
MFGVWWCPGETRPQPAQQYKSAKQWDVVLEYCSKALLLAEDMMIWNNPEKRKARVGPLTTD